MSEIFANLPYELKLYIFTYSRKPQSRRLLRDIENFSYTWPVLKAAYYQIWIDEWEETEEDAHGWIQNDIMRYVNEEQPTQIIYTSNFFDYWKRLYSINSYNEALKFNKRLFDVSRRTQNGNDSTLERISRNMWALLLPHERCSFLAMFLGST